MAIIFTLPWYQERNCKNIYCLAKDSVETWNLNAFHSLLSFINHVSTRLKFVVTTSEQSETNKNHFHSALVGHKGTLGISEKGCHIIAT